MKKLIPRAFAFAGFLVGLLGAWVSLPLLTSFSTSLWFLIGASAWGFLLWRILNGGSSEVFLAGWIWCVILHLGLLPLSPLIGRLLERGLPVPFLLLVMLALSVAGLVSELWFNTKA